MHLDLSSAIWIDPLVLAFIIGALWAPLTAITSRLTRKSRVDKQRNARLDGMLLDWTGEPARDGVMARPGVMARLGRIESHLDTIDHEVSFNSGTSIKDAVHRTDERVKELSDTLQLHLKDLGG